MPSGYSSRDVGDPSQVKKNKQSMADLKLRRLTELNNRLREDLERERIPVSQAAKRYVHFHFGYIARQVLMRNIASSRTPTVQRTSWYHQPGARSTRRMIRMRLSKAEDAARLCREAAMVDTSRALSGVKGFLR